jgi:phosphopantothenoylcysteine decarboxylase/phosphopantothenate--cysteine ligase
VRTAEEMRTAVLDEADSADALIMAAAVADFRPADPAAGKTKKDAAPDSIRLERTPDILKEIGKAKGKNGLPAVLVGFAAETENLEKNAQKKLKAKQLDLIVANEVGRPGTGFESDTNRVTIISADGAAQNLPEMDKYLVAEAVIERVIGLLTES